MFLLLYIKRKLNGKSRHVWIQRTAYRHPFPSSVCSQGPGSNDSPVVMNTLIVQILVSKYHFSNERSLGLLEAKTKFKAGVGKTQDKLGVSCHPENKERLMNRGGAVSKVAPDSLIDQRTWSRGWTNWSDKISNSIMSDYYPENQKLSKSPNNMNIFLDK